MKLIAASRDGRKSRGVKNMRAGYCASEPHGAAELIFPENLIEPQA
jgi:hypothetical protein